MDWPAWILAAAVRRLPAELGEWGAAMRAELTYIQDSRKRWQFAWGCVRVALFPPRSGGLFMNDRMKQWRATFGTAALCSLLINGILIFLASFSDNPAVQSGEAPIPWLDFFRNWLILTLIFAPIVHGLRVGEPMLLQQWLTTLGIAALFGLLLIAPFAFMEYWNNPGIRSGEFQFPFTLFFGLWLAPTVCFLGAIPSVRGLRAGESIWAYPLALLLRVAVMTFLVVVWINFLLDQMPCFLGGVPGCD